MLSKEGWEAQAENSPFEKGDIGIAVQNNTDSGITFL
jgi:hypothetical protein